MQELYPAIEPYRSGMLTVSERHQLYYEEVGRQDGLPAVFLHGGPGSGCSAMHRQFFDPQRYRAVLFDQRGAGRSTPYGELRENTTWDLVEDLERLREHLGISQWLVFGGSWGSTLALAYAQAHPQRVSGLILRGVFLGTPQEYDWLMAGPAGWIHPEAWHAFRSAIPAEEHGNMTQAYYRRLCSEDAAVRAAAVDAWNRWEGSIVSLLPSADGGAGLRGGTAAPARIECHYFINQCFLARERQLLEDVDRIRHIPTTIVQGRYDVICPMRAAWQLHRAWPEAELQIVTDGGHSALDPAIASALRAATDRFAASNSSTC